MISENPSLQVNRMSVKADRKPQKPGIYDNLVLQRREIWFAWEGELLRYGWCQRNSIQGASTLWKPHEVFGKFPDLTNDFVS